MTIENVLEMSLYRKVVQTETEWMDIGSFLDLPPVFCQRQTDFRKPKTKKLLKKKKIFQKKFLNDHKLYFE